jgi:glycosyltransferase involved in cell wall biosynthesis
MSLPPIDVSVVIPTYNRPDLLAGTLDAVLAQTRPAREIVIVDNGTDDRTEAMLRRYQGKVRYIRIEPAGVQVARNTGVRAATSSWVAMLDDDDLYRPDFLEHVEAAMDDGRADLVVTDHRKFNREGPQAETNFESAPAGYWDGIARPEGADCWSFAGAFPVERLVRYIGFYPSTMVIKKSLFDEVGGYDPGVRGIQTEDIEFATRLLTTARLAIVWKPLVDYRVHGTNTSGPWFQQKIGRWRVFEYIHDKNHHGHAALAEALAKDLPRRRMETFDLAFAREQFDLLPQVGARLRPEDWTLSRKMRRWIGMLPRPLALAITRGSRLLLGRPVERG